ncbi:MAG: hypothetical protein CW691_05115 [Candidatus Bathyarchaeum sp.]|nr:MAG: hypothetical protein CW691_05115 [Candidatus Bathyarchaeum sp.]
MLPYVNHYNACYLNLTRQLFIVSVWFSVVPKKQNISCSNYCATCVRMQLSDKINEIRCDWSSGASQIARNALGVLRFFVQTNKNTSCTGFVEDFSEVGRLLFDARPNMVPVQNLVAQIVYEVNTLDVHDLTVVQKFALSQIDKLCKQSEIAVKESAQNAAALIEDSVCLATCSYSSTVCESLKLAKLQGKNFKVFVAESKTGRVCYGQILAHFLESINVSVQVFPDNKICKYVPKTRCVLVGADSIACDGSVVNGTPTYDLAVASKDCGIPFYSVCETTKANTLSYLGKNVTLKSGFDLVPPILITGIITEKGILGTSEIVDIIKDKSKFLEIFHIQ